MMESACRFGDQGRLAGIITEPERMLGQKALILINAGLTPKFGPYRLYAQLARRLAKDGIPVLRFDLGGIGDSPSEYGGLPLRTRTTQEIRAAVDFLCERHDLGRVALGGLCSGAEDSFRYAESDRRITEVVLIDPFSYRTRGWRWRHLLYRAKRRSMRAVGLYRPIDYSAGAPGGKSGSLVTYRYMDYAESSRILRNLLERSVNVRFVYTGGMHNFNHPGQLKTMFREIDFQGLVTLDHFPHTDHTQMLEGDRRSLIDAIALRLTGERTRADTSSERTAAPIAQ
jgi:dienelactone hydrolase